MSDKTKTTEAENNETAVVPATNNETQVTVANLNNVNELKDLSEAEEFPIDLVGEYWTPETPGENKRVYFDSIRDRLYEDTATGEKLILSCAFFVEKVGDKIKVITNGSKKLVSTIESHNLKRGQPVSITFLGKKKNTTNANFSDQWSVKLIILQ